MKLPVVHPFLMALLREGRTAVPMPLAPDGQAWEHIIHGASQQGLIPILYQWSRESGRFLTLPPLVQDRLTSDIAGLAARNLVLTEELAAILRSCQDRALACVPLRGLALAEQLYGSSAVRPTGDIDLLVRREALPVMADMLDSLGYTEMTHRPGFASAFSYTLAFVKDRHGWVVVEPHWTLAYPPFTDTVDMDGVWTRCRRGRVVGVETWLLSQEDLLVHLCLHLIHQGHGAPLLWWYELDRLIRQEQDSLAWNQVVEIVQQAGQEALIAGVLETLRSSFDSPIPISVQTRLAESHQGRASFLRRRIVDLLVSAPSLGGREEFAQFIALRGLRAKVRYAMALLFPSPEFMIRRYGLTGRGRLGMSYLTRLIKLGWEGLKWTGSLLGITPATRPSPQR